MPFSSDQYHGGFAPVTKGSFAIPHATPQANKAATSLTNTLPYYFPPHSDSSFASSEASFSISEASWVSSRTADSQSSVIDHSDGEAPPPYSPPSSQESLSKHTKQLSIEQVEPALDQDFELKADSLVKTLDLSDVFDQYTTLGFSPGKTDRYTTKLHHPPNWSLSDTSAWSNHVLLASVPAANHDLRHRLPNDGGPDRSYDQKRFSTGVANGGCTQIEEDLNCKIEDVHRALLAMSEQDSLAFRPNPRRTAPDPGRALPTLIRQEARKQTHADHLKGVDTLTGGFKDPEYDPKLHADLTDSTEHLVAAIWPNARANPGFRARATHIPLRKFIQAILSRSHSSQATIMVAMQYCYVFWLHRQDDNEAIDGRRMYLASVMLAFKFLQDRNYSARAWSSISGLSKEEIMATQRKFLHRIDFKLYLDGSDLQAWQNIVARSFTFTRSKNYTCSWNILLREMRSHQIDSQARRETRLAAAASERLSDWDWSTSDIVSHESDRVRAERAASLASAAPHGRAVELAHGQYTPEASPVMALPITLVTPMAPPMSIASTPEGKSTAHSSPDSDVDAIRIEREQQDVSTVTPQAARASRTILLPRKNIRFASSSFTSSSSDDEVHEDGPRAPESMVTPRAGAGGRMIQAANGPNTDYYNWLEDNADFCDAYEDQVQAKGTRSAKKLAGQSAAGIARKRSIGGLGRGVETGKAKFRKS